MKPDTNSALVRGELLHFLADPGNGSEPAPGSVVHIADGALLVGQGRVQWCGPWTQARARAGPGLAVHDYSGMLLLPGFVDTHLHLPQAAMIASPAHGLLDWLERYTFPAERRFEDVAYAQAETTRFLDELARNGTTSAAVYGSVHAHSVDILMREAQARGLRLAAGKVMMDRGCPEWLRDDAQSSFDDSKRLVETWHRRGRLSYAITPRFALSSSEAQLEAAGALARAFPDTLVQTHLAENDSEVRAVARLHPGSRSYLDVYDGHGLLREGAVFGHCIHVDDRDRQRMAHTGSAASFCPSSNLFLNSGLFDLEKMLEAGVRVGLGSDVGAGTSFSMLRTMAAAWQVGRLAGQELGVWRAYWLATLAGAATLAMDQWIGNFGVGKEADFIVLDPQSTPLLAQRCAQAQSLEEKLFALMMLGDDRAVRATWILGQLQATVASGQRETPAAERKT